MRTVTTGVAGLVLLLSCTELLPPTGEPLPTPRGPTDVIDDLLYAYETRRIDVFISALIPENSSSSPDSVFRFYISPRLSVVTPTVEVKTVEIDSQYAYVPPGSYRYWTRESEVRSAERLFDKADWIEYTIRPLYEESDFVYHYDSLGDTVGVEVLMVGGTMTIQAPDATTPNTYSLFEVDIERQVFYLIKRAGRWYIKDWFDFGMTG
jgi:hypothetical protein